MEWIKGTTRLPNRDQKVTWKLIKEDGEISHAGYCDLNLFKYTELNWLLWLDETESTPKELEPDKKRIDEYDGRNPQTLYTYYEVEFVNMPVDWDTTICESLDEVRGVLQYVDIHLDDDTPLEDGQKRQVIVTGIPMTPYAFLKWAQDNYPEKYESMVTGSQSPYHNTPKEVEQRTPGETESESYWRNRCEKAEYELFKIKDKT